MEKYLTLLLFAIITTFSFAQGNYQEVVYLKNGSIIRGVIIEQVPNKIIKIQTADKSVYVYRMDEIEKITKEIIGNEKNGNTSIKRKGYIGLSIGPSIPVGDFADKSDGLAKTGLQLNLVNFGYLFSRNFGIAASWFGAANPVDANGIDPWSFGGLMVGPLISPTFSEKVDLDFKPMIGYCVATLPNVGLGTEQATSIAFSVGTQFRFHVGEKFSLLLSGDYFSAKSEFTDYGIEQHISTFTIGFGAAFRLR